MNSAEWLSNPARGIAKTARPAQVRMASLVEDTLANKGFAMIEAGTGTGKSFAYLVPAILSGKRIVISTAKKALQRQLRDSDLPFLLRALGSSAQYASLKGKNNYVCKLRFEDFLDSDYVDRFQAVAVEAFNRWVGTSTTGELDDCTFDVDFAHHVRVSECVARKCDYAEGCAYRNAKLKAGKAQIVIVNHALLAFDLAMGGGKIVGPYDALIIDEAHQAPKYFREAHTCRVHNKQPEALRKLLQDTGLNVPKTLEASVGKFLGQLPERGQVQKSSAVVENALDVIRDLTRLKQQFILEDVWSDRAVPEEEDTSTRDVRELGRLRAAVTVTQRMLKACEVCIEKLDAKFNDGGEEILTPQDYVTYMDTRIARGDVHKEFIATPIDIGPLVVPALKGIGTAVFTSATLSTGGTFDYMCRQFGFRPEEIATKEVMAQAFDYKKNSCLFISSRTSAYSRDTRSDYWRTCSKEMHELLTASKGGAFILCASFEDMTSFFDHLSVYRSPDYRLRTQSGNVDALIEWFKSDPSSVAIGVKSIWEGVDIPGMGLRLVIIPRLPFPNPDDPIFTAQKSRYVETTVRRGAVQKTAEINAWKRYDLQEAIMDFKQGAGRLIRRETDMGVVAVLDSRLYGSTKQYSGVVRSSIPHPPTYDLEATKSLLQVLSSKV